MSVFFKYFTFKMIVHMPFWLCWTILFRFFFFSFCFAFTGTVEVFFYFSPILIASSKQLGWIPMHQQNCLWRSTYTLHKDSGIWKIFPAQMSISNSTHWFHVQCLPHSKGVIALSLFKNNPITSLRKLMAAWLFIEVWMPMLSQLLPIYSLIYYNQNKWLFFFVHLLYRRYGNGALKSFCDSYFFKGTKLLLFLLLLQKSNKKINISFLTTNSETEQICKRLQGMYALKWPTQFFPGLTFFK